MTVKKELMKRGYRFPKLKNPKARAKFIAKNGYDPTIVLNHARRLKDGVGLGWEASFPPQGKKGKSRGRG